MTGSSIQDFWNLVAEGEARSACFGDDLYRRNKPDARTCELRAG